MTTPLSTSKNLTVSSIHIYPVKSLSGIDLERSFVEKEGLRFDRRFMIVDKEGNFLTQRDHGSLAVIKTKIRGGKLEIGSKSLNVDDDGARLMPVRVWKSSLEAAVCDSEVSGYLSEIVGREVLLVRLTERSKRMVNQAFGGQEDFVSFADGYPLLVANKASLAELNTKLPDQIGMERFRPNVVVSGAMPFEEDSWKRIKIGETVFRVSKPCARCVVTSIDQEKGERTGVEPLKTLAEFRKAKDVFPFNYEALDLAKNDVLFGTNLIPEVVGSVIKTGDAVEILEVN